MSLSMYAASVPVFVRTLGNLSAILKKAEADAAARGYDPAVLVNARLAPDMLPLAKQVQIACDSAKGCAARLGGIEAPVMPDTEASLPELIERVGKTLAFLGTVQAAQIDGSEGREIVLKMRGNEVKFQGQAFLLHFALPNFFFHVTTSYAILRHNGVVLGKSDYLGAA
jgi:hypothetical protein